MVVFPLACIENSVSYCTNTISNHAALFWGTSHHPYQTVVKSFLPSYLFLNCNVTVVAAWFITLCMVFSDYVKHLQWNKVFCCSSLPCAFCGLGWIKGSWTCRKLLEKPRKHKSCSAMSTWGSFPRWKWNWSWIRLFLVPWIYCISQQSLTWGLTACPKSLPCSCLVEFPLWTGTGVSTGEQRHFCGLTGMLGEAQGRVFSLKLAEAVFLTQVSALCFGRGFCKPCLISLCFSTPPWVI